MYRVSGKGPRLNPYCFRRFLAPAAAPHYPLTTCPCHQDTLKNALYRIDYYPQLTAHIQAIMPKQSTRHSYKTRRERNANVARKSKIIFLFTVILLLLLLIRSWREWWAWGKALMM